MNRTVAASLGVLVVILGGLLLTAALAVDKSHSLSPRVFPSEPVSLLTASLAGPPGNLSIVTPENGSFKDNSTNAFMTLHQYVDMSPIQGLEIKVDNGEYQTVPFSEIRVEIPPAQSHNELPGRFIKIMNRFENKLLPGVDAAPGMHAVTARMKTLNYPYWIESEKIKFTILPHANGANFTSMIPSYAFFDGEFTGLDCKKNRECTRKLLVYIPVSTGSASFADQKAKAEKAFADIKNLLVKACVTLSVEYKILTLGDMKGYNPANGTINDIEDFFHSVHKNAKVSNEDGKNTKEFAKEATTWNTKGPTPMILAEKVYQDYADTASASQHGLTFKSCTAVTKVSKDGKNSTVCNKGLSVFTLVAPSSEPGVMAHEIGHKSLQEANFNIEENGVEQHHTMDYKSSQNKPTEPLPADNFMKTPVPSPPLNMTEKQAGALYKACKENGGSLAMGNGKTTNYCMVVDTGILEMPTQMVCTDGGAQNEESCWGNTIPGQPKKDRGNYDPQHDYCPINNDCPGDNLPQGMKCDISRCVCVPWWWPEPGQNGPGIGDPNGGINGPNGVGPSNQGNGGANSLGEGGGEIL